MTTFERLLDEGRVRLLPSGKLVDSFGIGGLYKRARYPLGVAARSDLEEPLITFVPRRPLSTQEES